jgi:hypothetical protein
MKDLTTKEYVRDGLEDMVIITGLPRCGTSILGTLVGSFSKIEYSFEPEIISYFESQARYDQLQDDLIEDILLPTLFHSHFIENLSGRGYNFRQDDFSYILGMKSVPEVLDHWDKVSTKQDAVGLSSEYIFSFKYAAFYNLLSILWKKIPSIRVINIVRDLDRVISSVYAKDWFLDRNLTTESTGRWPYHKTETIHAPYYVDKKDVEMWECISPESRSVYFLNKYIKDCIEFHKKHKFKSEYMCIDYEDLVDSPKNTANRLAEFIDVSFGRKTENVISSIEPTSQAYELEAILNDCNKHVEQEFLSLKKEYNSVLK